MSIVAIALLLMAAEPPPPCDAVRAISVAKEKARGNGYAVDSMLVSAVLGPVDWDQLGMVEEIYREPKDLNREPSEVRGRTFFYVHLRDQVSRPGVVQIHGGCTVFVDSSTCNVLLVYP